MLAEDRVDPVYISFIWATNYKQFCLQKLNFFLFRDVVELQ